MNDSILNIVFLSIILFLFLFLVIFIIVTFVYRNKKNKNINLDLIKNKEQNIEENLADEKESKIILEKTIKETELLKKELEIEIKDYKFLNEKLENKFKEETKKLESISEMTKEEAKQILLESIERSLLKEKSKMIKEFNDSSYKYIKDKSIDLITEAMERNVDETIVPKTSFTIKLIDDNIKGRIIGKDGRNKKSFERVTGVDLIIEKEPEITLSSLNPIRRELARLLLEKLLESKNIEPSRIEKYYEKITTDFENKLYDIAENVLENELNIFDIDKDLYKTIGRLNFRTSYSQNILHHLKECALLASSIASELNLDPVKAKKAAFFHDIGKAVDFEIDNDHVESGLKIAKQYNLEPYIINAIESHHDKIACNNVYSSITKIVDKISASRPGVRFISHEEYIKRLNRIEEICNSFPGVKMSYAIKAGKQVRIIVNPTLINDDEAASLIFDIKTKLENDENVNKQPIEIILIRENRFEVKSDGSAKRIN